MYIEIHLPPTQEWQPTMASALMATLLERYIAHRPAFWIEATSEETSWIFDSSIREDKSVVSRLIKAYFPDAQLTKTPAYQLRYPVHQRVIWLRNRGNPYYVPLYFPLQIKENTDPLALFAQICDTLQDDELLRLSIQIKGTGMQIDEKTLDRDLTKPGARKARLSSSGDFFLDMARQIGADFAARRDREPLYQPAEERLFRAKATQTLYVVTLYLQAFAKTRQRLDVLTAATQIFDRLSDYAFFDSPVTFNHFIKNEDQLQSHFPDVLLRQISNSRNSEEKERFAFFLCKDELATLWHPPHKGFNAKRIGWVDNSNKPIPQVLKGQEAGIPLGFNQYGNELHYIYLPDEDRTSHALIIGKTGTGKSSLIFRMVHLDTWAGRGVCVIDPHGDLVDRLLHLPQLANELRNDVVILDLSMQSKGIHYPPPLNPLRRTAKGKLSRSIVATMRRIYDDFANTQMEYLLELALRTLEAADLPTLYDVQRLFKDDVYREYLISKTGVISLREEWDDYLKRSKEQQRNDLFPLLRRLRQVFLEDNEKMAVTCHPDQLDFYQLVNQNKVILVKLGAAGTPLDEPARLVLGAAIVEQIEQAAINGAIQYAPYMLYIDEAQMFINSPINKMLERVRKSGLGLVLANQYLGQWGGETQKAIEGNVGTLICFEVGVDDAKVMKKYMDTFTEADLTHLGKYRAAISMRYQDRRLPAFTLDLNLPVDRHITAETTQKRQTLLRRHSVANYTPRSYDEVINWLKQRYDSTPTDDISETDADDDFIEKG